MAIECQKHKGTIVAVSPERVEVRIVRLSGCAACASRSSCGLSEQKEMTVSVPTARWEEYHVGDNVTVVVASDNGLQAVLLAYIIPAVLLVAGFTIVVLTGGSEPAGSLVALGADAIYYGILYLCRRKVDRRFDFRLEE